MRKYLLTICLLIVSILAEADVVTKQRAENYATTYF
jgi:hypothetical protein